MSQPSRVLPMLPALPFAAYAVFVALVRRELRVEHVALAVVAIVLSYAGPRAKALLMTIYPFGLVGLVFDMHRPFQRAFVTERRVHLCDLRALEAKLFGWKENGELVTLHDWFSSHHWPAIDLLAAFPYATFILTSVVAATFLFFRDPPAARRFAWGWLLLNLLGFATYHVLPAAPPWYFHAHGCTVDLSAAATEGPALARVDALLGVQFFHQMYSRASSVYGALPSLHCAYPLLLVLEGWRAFGPRLRALAIAYWLLMIFAAVYLDHHWGVDALLGGIYAVTVYGLVRVPGALAARAKAEVPA